MAKVAQRVVDRRTPAQTALERLAKLAGQGVAAHRLTGATLDILADWRSSQPPADEMMERVETLHSSIEAGVQAAEDYVAEAESEAAKVAASRQLEALVAVRGVLAAEMGRA